MVSILTAGDKHFFKYVEDVKQQTGINLNIWGANPLEVTHFKAGFLGVKPKLGNQSKECLLTINLSNLIISISGLKQC